MVALQLAFAAIFVFVADQESRHASGTPGPAKPALVSNQADPRKLIGDPRTADPCSLARAAQPMVEKFGKVNLDGKSGNFDRCHLIVRLSPGLAEVDIEFQLRKPGPPSGPFRTTSEGRVSIAWAELNDDTCARILSTPEPYVADVRAMLNSGHGVDLCRMADDATAAMIWVLNGTVPLPRREFAPGSLGTRDACALIDIATLNRAKVDASAPVPSVGNWECRWGADGERSVAVRFDQSDRPVAPRDGNLIRLGSHRAFVEADGDESGNNCLVRIEYRSVSGIGNARWELVHVALDGPRPSVRAESLCAPAQEVAAAVERNLPG
jgi:eukaryotic-like serine/threonine-protein kinase